MSEVKPDYLKRRNGLRDIFKNSADASVLMDQISVRYLTGFSGSNAALFVGQNPEQDLLMTDHRYTERAKTESPDIKILIEGAFFKELYKLFEEHKIKKVAIDSTRLNISQGEALANKGAIELVGTVELLAPLRSFKDEYEIAQLRKACAITSETLWFLINDLRPGMTERKISNLFLEGILKRGADGLAFETIVASGVNSATPHHEPTNRPLELGDMVTIDCGAKVNGYHADMTRTVFLGSCSDWQKEIYDLVMNSQELGVKKLGFGVSGEEVDEVCRKYIEDGKHGEYFVHGTGHGVGLEIHEPTYVSKGVKTKLAKGSCVTVEPGIYVPAKGGVRIEDTCLVTENGAEILTTGSHEIIVVG